MFKTFIILCAVLAAALSLAACGAGGSGTNNVVQRMVVESYSLGTQERQLNLRGPQSSSSQPVTYYIFGSESALPDGGMVPLQQERLEEKAIGPLSMGQTQTTVDLSDWSEYTYIYVRAIPVQPNTIIQVRKGKRVDIWTT